MAMRQADIGIELWLVDLAACGPALEALEHETPRLADDDRERAAAIRHSIERGERRAAYIALRVLLERVAGASVRRRPLVRDQGRAPRLAEGRPRFSLSHTGGFALIGLSASLPIGVDVERRRPLKMAQRRRDEICAAGAGLGGKLPDADGDRAVVQAWVRLEAFTKARGRALVETLADLGLRGGARRTVPLANVEAAARRLAREAGLAVCDVGLAPELHGAVAVGIGSRLARPRRLPADREGLEELLAGPGPSASGTLP
jgi:4'-phosphopantetheinyl transferase